MIVAELIWIINLVAKGMLWWNDRIPTTAKEQKRLEWSYYLISKIQKKDDVGCWLKKKKKKKR